MTPEQAIGAETRDLCPGVAFDRIWKSDFQAAPGLAVNLNGSDFLTGKSLVGVEERRVDIGIQRLAAEVRHVEIVPWRELILSLERRFGIVAGCDDGSIATPHLDAIRLED